VKGHSSGGPVYKAAGGLIDAAYLASGGNPFVPKGTDTVPAMLTPGEFTVQKSAVDYAPRFVAAYNSNPRRALESVAGHSAQPVVVQVVNKSGARIQDLIEMFVTQNGNRMALQLGGGVA
jgi:hypothetical protein